MEGNRIVLNDGTIIENGEAGLTGASLWLWFPNMTMQEVATILFDDRKTKTIVFQYGNMEDVHVGFTKCVSLSLQDYQVIACMERG